MSDKTNKSRGSSIINIMYSSNINRNRPNPRAKAARKRNSFVKKLGLSVILILFVIGLVYTLSLSTKAQAPGKVASNIKSPSQIVKTLPAQVNACSSNSLSQLILVSIAQRHLWACAGSSVVYDSAVVTGMENLPADLTPVGTYHIYAKETDTYLQGHDSTGSWDDYVNYWMPFLDNQYGVYGIHDATWRASDAFGNISPYSSSASHGCVETPLATAAWIYKWAVVGTTVTVEA